MFTQGRYSRNRRHVCKQEFKNPARCLAFPHSKVPTQQSLGFAGRFAIVKFLIAAHAFMSSASTHPFAHLPFDGLVGLGFPRISRKRGVRQAHFPWCNKWFNRSVGTTLVDASLMSDPDTSASFRLKRVLHIHERRPQ